MHPRNVMTIVVAMIAMSVPQSTPAEPAQDPQQLQEQLRRLEAEIEKFRDMLEETRGERTRLESTLEANEKEISELLKRIEEIRKDIEAGEDRISDLRTRQRELDLAKQEQQRLIGKQIRAAYEIGDQEFLKVVLNQEDPNRIARMITYYDYFNRARAAQIARFRKTIADLDEVTRQIAARNEQLDADRIELGLRKAALEDVRAKKEETLIALNRQIRETGSELEIREKDRERLETLLERITASIVNLPTPADTVPFEERRGQLLLPVAGKIANRFGARRSAGGQLRWNGIFIEAEAGEPVAAIHYGRVVFSDWLRGFGLLLIINHGDGYMSLYGHNQVLYRESGDWVTAGEIIAKVGDSGGQQRSGLYFEIRHAGKPADPQHWCQARPQGSA